ncbi:GNAT family N-acetyltransferase [Vulcaniibacterium gelatinicum]|uniref:GNAT family N-acetyltransferase n=1 Tax=Vulcaniibacterium gelatinicum TaxID=2598725 RepID=UPI0011CB9435|nr:GNAT family N-acetyltransferase [Vulcaniibacterium gelatinicum]
MSAEPRPFHVETVAWETAADELNAVRTRVFVEEQQVPASLERDGLDPQCVHVIARTIDGAAIGAGRLTPDHRIGRMAVLREWRGRGVGQAMLSALVAEARRHGWREVTLHAQAPAIEFYARNGFVPVGERFMEAGIEHQAMRRDLAGAHAVETRDDAVAVTEALVRGARRLLCIYTRDLDPGLLDAPPVLEALRTLAVSGRGVEVRILLQDASTPQRDHAPLLALAQRLPSIFLFREVDDPVDRSYPSAYIASDAGGYYFRGLGHRFDGEADLHAPGRARQLRDDFAAVWERARPVTEYRALGL